MNDDEMNRFAEENGFWEAAYYANQRNAQKRNARVHSPNTGQ
jgi:predicted PhzF superfamily epimerase YddE/YHI9